MPTKNMQNNGASLASGIKIENMMQNCEKAIN